MTGSYISLQNEKSSGRFLALLHPNGELHTGASYSNIETDISPEFLESKTDFLETAELLVIDCNLSKESIGWLLNFSIQNNIYIIVEPVSLSKSLMYASIEMNTSPSLEKSNLIPR